MSTKYFVSNRRFYFNSPNSKSTKYRLHRYKIKPQHKWREKYKHVYRGKKIMRRYKKITSQRSKPEQMNKSGMRNDLAIPMFSK